jgi:hypothetical protein
MDSLVLPWVNTETMSMFLTMVSERHENEFVSAPLKTGKE